MCLGLIFGRNLICRFLLANKMKNIEVQKAKSFSYSNINGKENSLSETEDKGMWFDVVYLYVTKFH